MKNRKGFVFAETVVVISVVAVALLSLYTVFYTVYNEENKRINYDNSQDLYALYYVRKYLNEDNKINNCIFNLSQIQDTIYFKEINNEGLDNYECKIEESDDASNDTENSDNNVTSENIEDNSTLGKMKKTFEIEKLYLIKGNKVSNLKKSNTKNIMDEEIIDYLRTMKNSNNDNEYYLLGEFKTELPIEETVNNVFRVASITIKKG